MDQIYAWKQQWLEIYRSKSRYIDMGIKFIVGLFVFFYINIQIGFMSSLNNIIVVLGLAVVSTILSYGGIVLVAVMVTLMHILSLSMVLAACMAVMFLIIFIVYFRFTADQSLVVLLTPVTLAMGMPAAMPIACGLLVGPIAVIPMSVGAIIYSLIKEISGMADTVNGEMSLDGALEDALAFVTSLKANKEIMFYIVVMLATTVVVYLVRKLQINHAWKIAVASGYVASFIVSLMVNVILGAGVSFIVILFGNLLAVAIGLGVEIFYLGVDYKKTEVVEFEDDEYHYYVKMVPKLDGGRKSKRRGRTLSHRMEEVEILEETDEVEEAYDDVYDEEEYEYEEDVEYMEAEEGVEYLEEEEDIEYLEDESEDESEEDDMSELFFRDPSEVERELAYEMDTEFEQGSTTIIDSEEIERELRSNAHEKSMNSEENKNKHKAANYEMLKNSLGGNRRNRKNKRSSR